MSQEDQEDKTLCRQTGAASCSQDPLLQNPVISWRDSNVEHRQSRRFLECVDDNFLLKVIEEPVRRGAVTINNEGLVVSVKLKRQSYL